MTAASLGPPPGMPYPPPITVWCDRPITLQCKGKSYSIGRLEAVYISEGACYLRVFYEGFFHAFVFTAEKAEEFMREFLRTWGTIHRARLSTSVKLRDIDYNPARENKWALTCVGQRDVFLNLLEDYLNQPKALKDQIRRVQTLIKSIMNLQMVCETDFAHLMALKDLSIIEASEAQKYFDSALIIPLDSPTQRFSQQIASFSRNNFYTLNQDGDLIWGHTLDALADQLDDDFRVRCFGERFSCVKQFATALRELGGEFPIEDSRVEGLIQHICDASAEEKALIGTYIPLNRRHQSFAEAMKQELLCIARYQRALLAQS